MRMNLKGAILSLFCGVLCLEQISAIDPEFSEAISGTLVSNGNTVYSYTSKQVNVFDGYLRADITLSITAVDYSAWSTQGQEGIWLGIGFGSNVMEGTDMVMCNFLFSGVTAAGDKFICTDRIADASRYQLPDLDTQNDVEYISTTKTYNTAAKTVDLSVNFRRKLDTQDEYGQDYVMKDGKTMDAIWAWGQIMSSVPQGHGNRDWNRGSFRLKINSLLSGASALSQIYTQITLMACSVLVFSSLLI